MQGSDHGVTPEIPDNEEREYNKNSPEGGHLQSELFGGHVATTIGELESRMGCHRRPLSPTNLFGRFSKSFTICFLLLISLGLQASSFKACYRDLDH
jgi:hypothetical protein